MTRNPRRHALCLLLAFSVLPACAGTETGEVSPCHGRFRAEGRYFATLTQSDGSTVVVSTKAGPAPGCAG